MTRAELERVRPGDQVFFKTGRKDHYLPVRVDEVDMDMEAVQGTVMNEDGSELAVLVWPGKRVFTDDK